MQKIAILAILVATAAVGTAQSLKSYAESMDKKLNAVMMKKDIDGFVKIVKPMVTKDFKYVENGQTMNFDAMVSMMRQGMGMLEKMTKVSSKILSCKESGNNGVIMSSHMSEGIMTGPDKKKHTMGFTGKSKDIYVKMKGKWMLKSMTWTESVMTMDGKKVDPAAMGGGK
jgi:23S rRNA pseudoU1915 N3-methylase RlmH